MVPIELLVLQAAFVVLHLLLLKEHLPAVDVEDGLLAQSVPALALIAERFVQK